MIAMGGVAAIMHLWRKNSSKVISDDTSPGPAEAMTHDHIMCRALREIAAEDSDQVCLMHDSRQSCLLLVGIPIMMRINTVASSHNSLI